MKFIGQLEQHAEDDPLIRRKMLRSPAQANDPAAVHVHRELYNGKAVCAGILCGLGGTDEVKFASRKDGKPNDFVSQKELFSGRVLDYADCEYWCFKHAHRAGLGWGNFFVQLVRDEHLSTCVCTRDCPTGFIETDYPGAVIGLPEFTYGKEGPSDDVDCLAVQYPH